MHQIQFRPGIRPRPRWGAYSAPQTPWLNLRGPISKGREGREGEGRGWKGKIGEGGTPGSCLHPWREILDKTLMS